MIKKQFLIPECYVHKVPVCDNCNEVLVDTGIMNMSNPSQCKFVCPKCNKEYTFFEKDLRGEWKWRTI